jgi:phosphoadenosine phosphosulfate reductase
VSLKETTLFGDVDKVAIAIMRIKEFEPIALKNNPAGYYVCISGGKDSSVIQELCITAGVKCEFVHNHTSVDHPETIYFVRKEKSRLEAAGYIFRIEIPRNRHGIQKTMWNQVPVSGLPLRSQRWCCAQLKEFGGKNRYCITGVRWAESNRRASQRSVHEVKGKIKNEYIVYNSDNDMRRKLTEMCLMKQSFVLNPIVDWTDDDVWEFINERNLPINPLYAQGFKRVGCVGCPMGNARKELDMFPKYKALYYKAAIEYWKRRKERSGEMYGMLKSPESYFEWWLRG